VVLLVEVVFALVLAAVLLGERLAPSGFLGSALILTSVLLASRDRTEEAAVGPDVVPEQPAARAGNE
jgi:drug/metabolite transporter (DMT)-like permease